MPRLTVHGDFNRQRKAGPFSVGKGCGLRLTRFMVAAVVLLFFVHSPVSAEGPAQLQKAFQEGAELYQAGQFEASLEAFGKILAAGYESGPIYYNMGNCHYKLGQTGQAILFYERARKFMPKDPDLAANLALANLAVVDRIEPAPRFWLVAAWHAFSHLFPLPVTRLLTALLFVLTCILIIWMILAGPGLRRFLLRLCWLSGILLFILVLSWWGGAHEAKSRVEAVLIAPKVEIMSAPTAQGGVEVFSLHEGTKVRIDRMQDEWAEIVLPDLKVGWIKKHALATI